MYRLTRQLKTHYGFGKRILCMPATSENYLYPHISADIQMITCKKCKAILLNQNKALCPFLKTTSREAPQCNLTQTPCDVFGNHDCQTLFEILSPINQEGIWKNR